MLSVWGVSEGASSEIELHWLYTSTDQEVVRNAACELSRSLYGRTVVKDRKDRIVLRFEDGAEVPDFQV